MADNKVQSFENHAQIVPMFHYVTLGILQLTFIGACVNLYQSWGDHARFYSASLLVTLTLGTLLGGGKLVLYTDADLPFDLEEVPRAVRLLQVQEADMLVAYRFDRTAEGTRRAL